MAETLGSLCDKLTIVKLKQFHTEDKDRLNSLDQQESMLSHEINDLFSAAVSGVIPPEKLTFSANKVYKKQGNEIETVAGTIGELFAKLAEVNCNLWHEQEKVYEFGSVPMDQKDLVVKQLAKLNLSRNECIDAIDRSFKKLITEKDV